MRIKSLFGIFVILCTFSFSGCNDDDNFNPFPEGTSSLRMMNEDNGKVILGNSDVYITSEGNFKSGNYPIFDLGEKRGISDLHVPNFINMAPEVAVQPKHGYIICSPDDICTFDSRKKAIRENADIYRVFVDSWIKDKDGKETGANVHFLLGKPILDESIYMPAWGGNIGTLTWNYDMGETNTLELILPASDANDMEVMPITENSEKWISYSLNKNSIIFGLKDVPWITTDDFALRIRCKNICTEVTITVKNPH